MADQKNDNIGDQHDDGLWPDFETSTQSVKVAEAPARRSQDTEIKKPAAKKADKAPADS